MKKKDIFIIAIPLLIAAIIYPMLPARIPRQFGLNGQPTSYMAKEFIFLLGLVPYLIFKYYQARKHR